MGVMKRINTERIQNPDLDGEGDELAAMRRYVEAERRPEHEMPLFDDEETDP